VTIFPKRQICKTTKSSNFLLIHHIAQRRFFDKEFPLGRFFKDSLPRKLGYFVGWLQEEKNEWTPTLFPNAFTIQ
jgi:hypothetical protein